MVDIDADTFGNMEFEIIDENVPFRIEKIDRQLARIRVNG